MLRSPKPWQRRDIAEALRLEVAELPGIFLQGGIGGNQPIDLRQGDQSQVAVGSERLEQRELSFLFHDSKSFTFVHRK